MAEQPTYTLVVDEMPDGTRIVHNAGAITLQVKRADGSHEPLAPGATLELEPQDTVVARAGFEPATSGL